MTQSRTLPAGDVFRRRLIMMLAEGVPYRMIQERLDTTAPTISRWKERFLRQRMDGLNEIRHPGQQPSVITPALYVTDEVMRVEHRNPPCTHRTSCSLTRLWQEIFSRGSANPLEFVAS